MIRDYEKVIERLMALADLPDTNRWHSQTARDAVLVIREMERDLAALSHRLKSAEKNTHSENPAAGEGGLLGNPGGNSGGAEGGTEVPKKVGRPKKQPSGSTTESKQGSD